MPPATVESRCLLRRRQIGMSHHIPLAGYAPRLQTLCGAARTTKIQNYRLIELCGKILPDQMLIFTGYDSSTAADASAPSSSKPASAWLSSLPASASPSAPPLAVAFARPPRALFALPLPPASRAQSTLYCALRTKIWALTSPSWPQRTPILAHFWKLYSGK